MIILPGRGFLIGGPSVSVHEINRATPFWPADFLLRSLRTALWVSLVSIFFLSGCFQDSLLILDCCPFNYYVPCCSLPGVPFARGCLYFQDLSVSFPRLWKFSTIISSKRLSTPLPLSSLPDTLLCKWYSVWIGHIVLIILAAPETLFPPSVPQLCCGPVL